jgi:hypothetical protein
LRRDICQQKQDIVAAIDTDVVTIDTAIVAAIDTAIIAQHKYTDVSFKNEDLQDKELKCHI